MKRVNMFYLLKNYLIILVTMFFESLLWCEQLYKVSGWDDNAGRGIWFSQNAD